jgi:hypothetical protein
MGGGAGGSGGGALTPFITQIGPITLAASEERTVCVTRRLGNTTAFHASEVHTLLIGPAWHELVVYRVNDTVESLTPTNCPTLGGFIGADGGTALVYTKLPDENLVLPSGLGFSFAANQMLRLELHALNAGTSTVDASARIDVQPLDESTFSTEAGMLLTSTLAINIPPGQTTIETNYTLPQAFVGTSAFELTGYTHKLGVDMFASSGFTQIYAPSVYVYDNPQIATPNPPVDLPADGGLKVTCIYQNPTSSTVTFGSSANDERCDLRLYYSPARSTQLCVHVGGTTACCPGGPGC